MGNKTGLPEQPDASVSLQGRWRWLFLLLLCAILNYVDRLAIAVLQVPIKAELGLTDTDLGILTGLSFAMVYTIAAVPIAGFADRYSRKLIIILALLTWSSMTLLCGFATSFVALCIFRMGVAVGEAGCSPSSLAIIADSFSEKRRARAIAIWHYGFPIGATIGIGGSGLAAAYLGWRDTFVLLGVIGLLLAPVLWVWLGDPNQSAGRERAPSRGLLSQVASAWSSPAFRLNLWAGALLAYAYQVVLNWSPPLYHRTFSVPLTEAAGFLSIAIAGGGIAGVTLATLLAPLPSRRDVRWYFWLPAITSTIFAVALLIQCLVQDARLSLLIAFIPFVAFNTAIPAWVACGQLLVKPNERAMAAGLQTFFCGVIGGAGGPFITGILSDFLAKELGSSAEGLRWAVASSALMALSASVIFLRGARRISRELPHGMRADLSPDVAKQTALLDFSPDAK